MESDNEYCPETTVYGASTSEYVTGNSARTPAATRRLDDDELSFHATRGQGNPGYVRVGIEPLVESDVVLQRAVEERSREAGTSIEAARVQARRSSARSRRT